MPLKIVCVNAGNYLGRGAEYVNTLFDMVCRNISDKQSFQFQCFTDTPDGLNPAILTRPVHGELKGWWNKIYMFKPGVFAADDKVVFIDLDTVIVGGLDEILKYDGGFAILRDFYNPTHYQSSLMIWKPSAVTEEIWNTWEAKGKPQDDERGDQWWIEGSIANVDFLQDKFPGFFVSYKVHCMIDFPRHSRVVCFHGMPRPHEITTGWMPHVWKVGGGTTLELENVCNTAPSDLRRNIEYSMSLDRPALDQSQAHGRIAIIVGGGPSLNDCIDAIEAAHKWGVTVFATNNTAKKLIALNIMPDFHVLGDARAENAEFVPADHWDGVSALYSSQCHKDVFTSSAAMDVTIYHPFIPGILQVIGDKQCALVGGNTTGMQAMCIAYTMGYRTIHLYGFDSSYRDGQGHAYRQKMNDGEKTIEVQAGGRTFTTAPWMASQVDDFRHLSAQLVTDGCTVVVHGDGLLPHVAKLMQVKKEAA